MSLLLKRGMQSESIYLYISMSERLIRIKKKCLPCLFINRYFQQLRVFKPLISLLFFHWGESWTMYELCASQCLALAWSHCSQVHFFLPTLGSVTCRYFDIAALQMDSRGAYEASQTKWTSCLHTCPSFEPCEASGIQRDGEMSPRPTLLFLNLVSAPCLDKVCRLEITCQYLKPFIWLPGSTQSKDI